MTLVGWIVLSNHCALGGMATQSVVQKAHGCCHSGASLPPKEPADTGSMECCKSLHAVVPDGAKPGDLPPPFVVGSFMAWMLIHDARIEAPTVLCAGTGPPRVATFSELVLHRSLRSHAPPFLA